MNNETLKYYIFLSNLQGIGSVKINQIIKRNEQLKLNIDTFFKLSKFDLEKNYSFIPTIALQQIVSSKGFLDKVERFIDYLYYKNIHIVTILEQDYPSNLKYNLGFSAPPILYLEGNKALLKENLVGVVGSRKPTYEAGTIAKICSKTLVNNEFTIVSGYAEGIDKIAHNSALRNNGNTIIVLGYGILNFSVEKLINVNEQNYLALSEFFPKSEWNKGFLLTRNRTICGLSNAIFIIQGKEISGTYNTGNYAITMQKKTFIIDFQKKNTSYLGNEKLLKKGGIPIIFKSYDQIEKDLIKLSNKLKDQPSLAVNQLDQYQLFDELNNGFQNKID